MSLSSHRIADIEPATVHYTSTRNVGRNARLGNHGSSGDVPIVTITTDTGVTGWGETIGPRAAAEDLIGRSVAEVFDPTVGFVDPRASFLDIALHDLAGQILDQPVYAMLGAAGSRDVRAYAGGIYFDDLDPDHAPLGLGAIRDNLATDAAAGFRDFKLKIGRGRQWMLDGGMERDIEVTRITRDLYPEARILVDANDGYTIEDAERYLCAVADCGLYWMEELFPESETELRRLRELVDELSPGTLIADGESGDALILDLARAGLVDVALMDAATYGITNWRYTMPKLAAAGVRASPHTWGSPLRTFYTAHLAAGLGNIEIVEAMPSAVHEADTSAYGFAEGIVSVPDRPGFGIGLIR